MKEGEKHFRVMLTFFFVGGVETGGEPHIKKMAACLQTKLCPHAVANKVAISLKETAFGLSGGGLRCASSPPRTAETEELWSQGSRISSRCRLEQNVEAAGCAGSRRIKAASK